MASRQHRACTAPRLNGMRMKLFVAPTRRMISIAGAAMTVRRTAFEITNAPRSARSPHQHAQVRIPECAELRHQMSP
jgi:hypothetical protein